MRALGAGRSPQQAWQAGVEELARYMEMQKRDPRPLPQAASVAPAEAAPVDAAAANAAAPAERTAARVRIL
jgi:hypothetical protein